ncbi:MAG: hypothetical protein WDZ49_14880 [Litorilinea sp.]
MGFVIQYVAIYAPWIYAICGLVALYQIYKIWFVRAERKQAVFSLEREKAVHDTYNIFAIAVILLAVMGLTYFTSTTLVQAVEPLVTEARSPSPPLLFVPTPTNTPLPATPVPTSTPLPPPGADTGEDGALDAEDPLAANTPSDVVDPAAALEQQVVETEPAAEPAPEPEAPVAAVEAPVCPDSRSVILRPGNNESVSGVINVIGTATHESFQFFKVEFAPGVNAADGFGYLDGGSSPVISNFLISVDTLALGNGPWTLRLEVVDQTGNYIPRCQVTVYVNN